jgi:hypothetical protein
MTLENSSSFISKEEMNAIGIKGFRFLYPVVNLKAAHFGHVYVGQNKVVIIRKAACKSTKRILAGAERVYCKVALCVKPGLQD